MAKLTILGLDGVNWKILDQAIEKGYMPNLESIIEESTTAELETTYPPVTGPAWTSIMTGQNPGNHGVYDFVNHVENGRPYNSSDIDAETVYEAVADRGEVMMVNLPLSYPPRYEGDFVGSFLAPEDDFIRPETLKQEHDFSEYKKSLTAVEKTLSVVKSSRKVAEEKKKLLDSKLDDQDLFFMLFSAPDWMMHNLYHKMEEGGAENAYRVFKIMDDAIGTADERSENLILLSDHGFESFEKVFHTNQWLRENGYLQTEGSMGSQWSDNEVINTVLKQVSDNSYSRKFARKIYQTVEPVIPFTENVKIRLNAALSEGINMDQTQAFCPTSGIRGVYINDGRFEGVVEDVEKLKEQLVEEIPDYMNPMVREEKFSGPHLEEGPDIIFEEEKYRVSRGIYGKVISDKQVNHHGRKGFFVARGQNFEKADIEEVSLYDIAPTVAELFNLDFEADGDVIPVVSDKYGLEKEKMDIDF